MTWDELKFEAEDCEEYILKGYSDSAPEKCLSLYEANRILKEKTEALFKELEELRKLRDEVEKAPEVFAVLTEIGFSNWSMNPGNALFPNKDSHKARLVCIEEIKKD